MRFFFLDASALAKRYAPEAGTVLVDHLFASVSLDRLYLFNVGMAEVLSILVRKKNAGRLSAVTFSQALMEFGAEIVTSNTPRKIGAGNALVAAALPLIEVHSINATDAMVLRLALNLAARLRAAADDVVVVASDQRLLRAAQAEGLLTFNPEAQTMLTWLLC